jgi:hypothetical protein
VINGQIGVSPGGKVVIQQAPNNQATAEAGGSK